MQTVGIDTAPGDFRLLALRVRDAGLLDRRPVYYTLKIVLTVAIFGAGWAALVAVGNSWATLGVAAFLGLAFTQLGFLGHDAGHGQVFNSRRANRRLGLSVGNVLIGLSFGWWVSKHSAHHAHPNQVDLDPDIGDNPVATQSTGRQAWLFFPFMLTRSLGLHVSGIQRLIRQRDRAAALEGSLIALHAALYLTALLWVLSPLKALAFIAVQQSIFSMYLGCSFAPNHKGMPLLERNVQMSFARRQVITARNVTGGWFTTFMLGGLNYQIEHHLFPTMPRPNLKRAQDLIRAFCVGSDLGYSEDTLVGSFHQAVSHPSVELAAPPAAPPPALVTQGAGRS